MCNNECISFGFTCAHVRHYLCILVCTKAFEPLLGQCTVDKVWAITMWSFKCIAQGTFPKHNWERKVFEDSSLAAKLAGQPLANGWKGLLVSLEGDLEYFTRYLGVPRWNANVTCCALLPQGPEHFMISVTQLFEWEHLSRCNMS